MIPELGMAVVVIGFDGGILDGAVHAFDLAIGPGMIGFSQAMIDVMAGTGEFKSMSPEDLALLPGQFDVGGR